MKTEELIAVLSQAPRPEKPVRFALFFALFFMATAVVTIAGLGFRPEIPALHIPVSFWVKTLALASFAALALLFLVLTI